MRHLLFVAALSSSVTPFLSGREAPSSSPADVQSAVALGPHEHRGRLLGTNTEHQPGIAPLDFGAANVTNSNLGGLCGQSCQGTIDGTGVRRFNTTTGLCTFHDIQATEGTTPCLAAHEMYYQGVGTTLSGTQVDLRVTNVSRYLPFKATANGLSGVWGAINVLTNHPADFLFEFVDSSTGDPVVLDEFGFTFLDLDTWNKGYEEQVTIRQTLLNPDNPYQFYRNGSLVSLTAAERTAAGIKINVSSAGTDSDNQPAYSFRSTQVNGGENNPTSFSNLTATTPTTAPDGGEALMQQQAVQLNFLRTSSFVVRLSAVWP